MAIVKSRVGIEIGKFLVLLNLNRFFLGVLKKVIFLNYENADAQNHKKSIEDSYKCQEYDDQLQTIFFKMHRNINIIILILSFIILCGTFILFVWINTNIKDAKLVLWTPYFNSIDSDHDVCINTSQPNVCSDNH